MTISVKSSQPKQFDEVLKNIERLSALIEKDKAVSITASFDKGDLSSNVVKTVENRDLVEIELAIKRSRSENRDTTLRASKKTGSGLRQRLMHNLLKNKKDRRIALSLVNFILRKSK